MRVRLGRFDGQCFSKLEKNCRDAELQLQNRQKPLILVSALVEVPMFFSTNKEFETDSKHSALIT
jgi:hypothetical protein